MNDANVHNAGNTRKHDRIQRAIVAACGGIGVPTKQEQVGLDWRADVYIPNNGQPIAFEIQLSPQSLRRTLERQAKYIRDGVIGCWLFEKPVPKLNEERSDLPVFYVEDTEDGNLLVNLGDRRKLDLSIFLENFISNNIRFQPMAKAKTEQVVDLVFYEMQCWKCQAINHLYYVESIFRSACNAAIKPEEALWESNSIEYRPEMIQLAQQFIDSIEAPLQLAQVKERFSHTVDKSYLSFGCYQCDSLFGDFYVMDAKMDMIYAPKELTCQGEIDLTEQIEMSVPHWCFPDNNQFCNNNL